ncbi:hypothetical protein [Aliamphritea spongicola]|nr:hypothetical protein [Aliamphritea spongicola]
MTVEISKERVQQIADRMNRQLGSVEGLGNGGICRNICMFTMLQRPSHCWSIWYMCTPKITRTGR